MNVVAWECNLSSHRGIFRRICDNVDDFIPLRVKNFKIHLENKVSVKLFIVACLVNKLWKEYLLIILNRKCMFSLILWSDTIIVMLCWKRKMKKCSKHNNFFFKLSKHKKLPKFSQESYVVLKKKVVLCLGFETLQKLGFS